MWGRTAFCERVEYCLWKLRENGPFLAHFTLKVTYLEVVAAETTPAGILVTKGIHLSSFHSHQWDIFSCFPNAAPSDKQLIGAVWCPGRVSLVPCHMLTADLHRQRRCQENFLGFHQLSLLRHHHLLLWSVPPLPICTGRGCEKAGKRGWIL